MWSMFRDHFLRAGQELEQGAGQGSLQPPLHGGLAGALQGQAGHTLRSLGRRTRGAPLGAGAWPSLQASAPACIDLAWIGLAAAVTWFGEVWQLPTARPARPRHAGPQPWLEWSLGLGAAGGALQARAGGH